MRRFFVGLLIVVGLGTFGPDAHALPGVKVKTPKVPDAPGVPDAPKFERMSVADALRALDDADRKLDRSAKTLFAAEMSVLEAVGRADLALEYRAKVEKLQADAAAEERDADLVEVATDKAIIEAMVAALEDKEQEMDAERKVAARKANIQIIVARLMAAATAEDAATVGGATVDMNQRLAQGDESLANELKDHSSDGPAFVTGMSGRAGGIKKSSTSMIAQSRAVSDVMDKYRKKKKLFEPITTEEAKAVFEQSGF